MSTQVLRALSTWVSLSQDGQTLSEYTLILAFIFLVVIAALTLFGSDVAAALGAVTTGL